MNVPDKIRGNKSRKHRLGIPLSKETKRKQSEAAKARKKSKETRRKMSKAQKGRKKSL